MGFIKGLAVLTAFVFLVLWGAGLPERQPAPPDGHCDLKESCWELQFQSSGMNSASVQANGMDAGECMRELRRRGGGAAGYMCNPGIDR